MRRDRSARTVSRDPTQLQIAIVTWIVRTDRRRRRHIRLGRLTPREFKISRNTTSRTGNVTTNRHSSGKQFRTNCVSLSDRFIDDSSTCELVVVTVILVCMRSRLYAVVTGRGAKMVSGIDVNTDLLRAASELIDSAVGIASLGSVQGAAQVGHQDMDQVINRFADRWGKGVQGLKSDVVECDLVGRSGNRRRSAILGVLD